MDSLFIFPCLLIVFFLRHVVGVLLTGARASKGLDLASSSHILSSDMKKSSFKYEVTGKVQGIILQKNCLFCPCQEGSELLQPEPGTVHMR